MDPVLEKDNETAIAFLKESGAFKCFYPDDVDKIQQYLVNYVLDLENKGVIKFTANRN